MAAHLKMVRAFINGRPRSLYTAVQSQKAVSAYLLSKKNKSLAFHGGIAKGQCITSYELAK